MCLQIILDILTSVGTIGAVIIAMIAIYRSDKNNKEQIVTIKLEELLELIKTLGRYYAKLKDLNNDIQNLRNPDYKQLETLSQYYEIRDVKLSKDEREKIFEKLSRLEVLAKCYTKGSLKEDILKYEDLFYSFSELISNGGSINVELKWKEGLPKYEEFYIILMNLEKQIVNQITAKK